LSDWNILFVITSTNIAASSSFSSTNYPTLSFHKFFFSKMDHHDFLFMEGKFWENFRTDLIRYVKQFQPDFKGVHLHDIPMIREGLLAQIKTKTNATARAGRDLKLMANNSELGTGLFNADQVISKGDTIFISKPLTAVINDTTDGSLDQKTIQNMSRGICHWCFAIRTGQDKLIDFPARQMKIVDRLHQCPGCGVCSYCDEVSMSR
jgi:hypothetical protein